MAFLQPSYLSSLNSTALFPFQNRRSNCPFRLSFSLNQSNDEAAKLALERAKAYKESLKPNQDAKVKQNPGLERQSEGKEPSKPLTVSSIDFMGLDFADKRKDRGPPPGLVPIVDPFPEEDFPEVEIIVGDTSKFMEATTSDSEAKPKTSDPRPNTEDDSYLYKPKVSTWGVFPRPDNISKTFGGGRNIRPGDLLETEEERAAKEERTKQLIAAYKRKVGLSVDPKLKAECQKALEDGDSLMDSGMLKQALPYYEKVMEKMVFQSELHGLAALQWSICVDSLCRPNEARKMYEKLQSHPSATVSKKARQFVDSFKAMEMMKVTGSNPFLNTGYQNYFDTYLGDKYALEVVEVGQGEEDAVSQVLTYMIFLISPIFIVLFIAVQKGNIN
ncbi:hypothetical protein SLA2020_062920 [Shorea laevis]